MNQAMTLDKLPKRVLARIDLQIAFMASQCVLVADHLGVFRILHNKELTAAEIGKRTGIRQPRLKWFLSALVSIGLLRERGNNYTNTALANKYYVRNRSEHWSKIFSSECQQEYRAFSALEQMLTTGKGYEEILGYKRKDYLDLMKDDQAWARDFTLMLYHEHVLTAKALADTIDLTEYKNVLDIGGGSGVMSIALARKYKRLRFSVFEIAPVAKVARGVIANEKLSERISVIVGDMYGQLPTGYDVVMLCDAGHISQDFLKSIYDVLPRGGLFILVEEFASVDYTEPFYRLMWQLRSEQDWLITSSEAVGEVKQTGFKSVRKRRLYRDAWLVTGRK
jgi:cyclopropane fatty-acyl-phospholipid synthase-like methyltransferase